MADSGPRTKQAAMVLGAAAALWAGWALFGTPVRVGWLVARGAPPAGPEASAASAEALAQLGTGVRDDLFAKFRDPSLTRARKSWVAAVLLRAPFFARSEVEKGLEAPDAGTRRAAAFALLGGEEETTGFEEAVAQVIHRAGPAPPPPPDAWDPAPAVPVLLEWLADRDDPEAKLAARLLGRIPPEPRVKEALLRTVEEAREILAPGADPALQIRKFAAIDAIQALLPYAREDAETVSRLCGVLRWIVENEREELGFDIGMYVLMVLEVSRGRGVDWDLIARLARSPNQVLRQRLANTLGDLKGPRVVETLSLLAGGRKGADGYRGDESPIVRRSALRSMMLRQDPEVNAIAPYLVEDSFIYVRAETLKTVGELHRIDPRGSEANLPLLVDCLQEPWPGPRVVTDSPLSRMIAGGEAEIVEWAALSLHMITGLNPGHPADEKVRPDAPGSSSHPGFPPRAMSFDGSLRREIAAELARDDERRARFVAAWRETVPARKEGDRVPWLAWHLEDRDPDNVLRAMRELHRITGDGTGFPDVALQVTGDDTAARNAIRVWMEEGRSTTLNHWLKDR